MKVQDGGKRKREDHAEDRYYTKAEYDALSPAQKKDLAAKRLKRGHTPGAKDSKSNKDKDKQQSKNNKIKNLKAVHRTVAQLAKQMGKTDIRQADDATCDDASESSEETQAHAVKFAPGTNRSNSSLTRQSSKSSGSNDLSGSSFF